MTLAREELALMTVYRMLTEGGIIPQFPSPPPLQTPPPQSPVVGNITFAPQDQAIRMPAPSAPYTETITSVIEILQTALKELPTDTPAITRVKNAIEILNCMIGIK